jgi:glycosyltransferase involved in cell wall biosynthesis
MKVSVITVCYNASLTIADTINSVLLQNHPDIEYIIIDGKSSDDTLRIIREYGNRISHVVSEKDNGMYDAINKGIGMASGEMIAILNSDDFYVNESVISGVVKWMNREKVDSVYGDLDYVAFDDITRLKRHWKSGKYKDGMFLEGWMPPHPAFFVKKKCYEDYGLFNTTLRTAADYELMLRFLHKYKVSTSYIPEVLVKMRVGGMSNISFRNRIRANKEDRRAWEINGLKPKWYTLWMKPLRKLDQFL